jgi:hypothetical protein
MKELDLKEINGNEIIDFLNKESMNNKNLTHISMSLGSFVFEEQKVKDEKYTLYFTASYNNWGTEQDITRNALYITKDEVWFSLCEPFEGDGTDDALQEVLSKWLDTHKFDEMYEERFYAILSHAHEQLPGISFESKKELQEVIDTLVKAQTYMK